MILALIILAACQPHQPQKTTYIENQESKLLPLLVQPEDLDSKSKWKTILISQQTFSPPQDERVEEASIILDGLSADKTPFYVEHGLLCYQHLATLADIGFDNPGASELLDIGQEAILSCKETPYRDSRILSCTLRVRYNNLISYVISRSSIPQSETYSNSYLKDLVKKLGLLINNRIDSEELCTD